MNYYIYANEDAKPQLYTEQQPNRILLFEGVSKSHAESVMARLMEGNSNENDNGEHKGTDR